MNRKEFETELHEIDPKLILTVLAHQGADEIDYYDGNQKIYKVFDFEKRLYDPKGSVFLSVNQFNKLTNLLFKAQALVRGRHTFDDMLNTTVHDSGSTVKEVAKSMAEPKKAYRKSNYEEKNYDNPFKKYTDKLADVLYKKNRDYGNSFDKTVNKIGHRVLLVRVMDKYDRIENLILNDEKNKVADESLKDTFLDLAGYSILSLRFLDNEEKEQKND